MGGIGEGNRLHLPLRARSDTCVCLGGEDDRLMSGLLLQLTVRNIITPRRWTGRMAECNQRLSSFARPPLTRPHPVPSRQIIEGVSSQMRYLRIFCYWKRIRSD